MEAMQLNSHIQAKNNATNKSTGGTICMKQRLFEIHKTTLTQPTWISQKKIKEIRAKCIAFGCNSKGSKEHKCQETKVFTLKTNDREKMETSTQWNEKELVNLKKQT